MACVQAGYVFFQPGLIAVDLGVVPSTCSCLEGEGRSSRGVQCNDSQSAACCTDTRLPQQGRWVNTVPHHVYQASDGQKRLHCTKDVQSAVKSDLQNLQASMAAAQKLGGTSSQSSVATVMRA